MAVGEVTAMSADQTATSPLTARAAVALLTLQLRAAEREADEAEAAASLDVEAASKQLETRLANDGRARGCEVGGVAGSGPRRGCSVDRRRDPASCAAACRPAAHADRHVAGPAHSLRCAARR